MTFNESQHPRKAEGTFTDKTQSAPEAALLKQRPAVAGDWVMVLDRPGVVSDVNGSLVVVYANGDRSLESDATVTIVEAADEQRAERNQAIAAVRAIDTRAHNLTDAEVHDLSWVLAQSNDGAWSNVRSRATAGIIDLDDAGLSDLWVSEEAVRVADFTPELDSFLTDEKHRAFGAAYDAARALAQRPFIGQTPDWTQEGYDHLTRAWRTTMGAIHPDDEVSPALWATMPVPDASQKRAFDADIVRFNGVIEAAGAKVEHDDDGEVWYSVDESKLTPAVAGLYARLQQFGYANGFLD